MEKTKRAPQGSCENCWNYNYNEECGCYECSKNLDEDETVRFVSRTVTGCPYFRPNDEYQVVNKQV